MNRKKEAKNYDKVSLIYEYIMRKIDYQTWAKYIYSLVKLNLNSNAKVLEIAAGNCRFANNFSKYFPDLTVTDLSINMLKCDAGNKLAKVCCDMTLLPFNNKFDLIYSTFDSINYLTSRKKLLTFLKQTAALLSDNGIFTFDASLERNSLIHIKEPYRKGNYNGILFEQRSEYNFETRIHKNIFSIVDNDKTHLEIHKQKIFPFETYFEMLNNGGLYVKDCFKAFTYDPGDSDSERVQFIIKRKKNVNI